MTQTAMAVWILLYIVTPTLSKNNEYMYHHQYDGRIMQAYGSQEQCIKATQDIKANSHDYGVCVEAYL